MDEIICRYLPFPATINAVTVLDGDGDFNVYINSSLSAAEQRRAFEHEKNHIIKNHFFKDLPIAVCEGEAQEVGACDKTRI